MGWHLADVLFLFTFRGVGACISRRHLTVCYNQAFQITNDCVMHHIVHARLHIKTFKGLSFRYHSKYIDSFYLPVISFVRAIPLNKIPTWLCTICKRALSTGSLDLHDMVIKTIRSILKTILLEVRQNKLSGPNGNALCKATPLLSAVCAMEHDI